MEEEKTIETILHLLKGDIMHAWNQKQWEHVKTYIKQYNEIRKNGLQYINQTEE